ncbi:MAG: JDVT-CTERM domain-containing protein [Polyangiales bacterium]
MDAGSDSDGGPSGFDAGADSDAGPSGLHGGTADAGSTTAPDASSGCTVGGSGSPSWFVAFALAGFVFVRRRRKRSCATERY